MGLSLRSPSPGNSRPQSSRGGAAGSIPVLKPLAQYLLFWYWSPCLLLCTVPWFNFCCISGSRNRMLLLTTTNMSALT
jgi:hypothetical protein